MEKIQLKMLHNKKSFCAKFEFSLSYIVVSLVYPKKNIFKIGNNGNDVSKEKYMVFSVTKAVVSNFLTKF